MTVKIKAYGKLNLLLDITGIMSNGYHCLDNVTQSVDSFDIITVTAQKADTMSLSVSCDNPQIPCNETNIVCKAAKKFCEKAGFSIKAEIDIAKNVPLMGGMGGSSVDAVGVIAGLNCIFSDTFSDNEIIKLCESIGADVPICYIGGTLYTKSDDKGSTITRCYTDTSCTFICIQPDFYCDTTAAYKLYDSCPTEKHLYTDLFMKKLMNTGIIKASENTYNIFAELYKNKKIDHIKNKLIEYGAIRSEMTGSGSVVYGIFSDDIAALSALSILKSEYNTVFMCHSTKTGYEIIG